MNIFKEHSACYKSIQLWAVMVDTIRTIPTKVLAWLKSILQGTLAYSLKDICAIHTIFLGNTIIPQFNGVEKQWAKSTGPEWCFLSGDMGSLIPETNWVKDKRHTDGCGAASKHRDTASGTSFSAPNRPQWCIHQLKVPILRLVCLSSHHLAFARPVYYFVVWDRFGCIMADTWHCCTCQHLHTAAAAERQRKKIKDET